MGCTRGRRGGGVKTSDGDAMVGGVAAADCTQINARTGLLETTCHSVPQSARKAVRRRCQLPTAQVADGARNTSRQASRNHAAQSDLREPSKRRKSCESGLILRKEKNATKQTRGSQQPCRHCVTISAQLRLARFDPQAGRVLGALNQHCIHCSISTQPQPRSNDFRSVVRSSRCSRRKRGLRQGRGHEQRCQRGLRAGLPKQLRWRPGRQAAKASGWQGLTIRAQRARWREPRCHPAARALTECP